MKKTDLVDLDGLNVVVFFFVEHDCKDAVFEFGFDCAFFFFDLNRKRDGAREFAPVTLLNVPGGSVFVFAAA